MTISREQIASTIQSYYQAWGTGDPQQVAAFFTADCVFEDLAFAARFEGHAGVRQFVEITFAGVPDFSITPTAVVVDEGQAAAAWTMTGTHAGDLPGLPATSKPFTVRASSIIELQDDRIRRIVDYWSPLDFMRQVGLAK
ncbi:MAG: ester cyclase [Acidobacteriota bacterium]